MKSVANRQTVKQAQMTTEQEMAVCSMVGEVLHVAYPGHVWRVEVQQGIVTVHNLLLSGQWGFRLLITDIDRMGKVVVRAGGELLERYNLSRAKRKNHVIGELSEMKRDFKGEVIHD